MTATEPALGRIWLGALPRWRPGEADLGRWLPLLVALAVGIGLVVMVVSTPIAARGDYGQWLMASRYYLGEPIPGYRDVTALPPLVPALLAGIRLVVADPVVALAMLNGLVLAGLLATFYLLGSTLLSSRWAGVLGLLIAFVISDRFLELYAFGALLQAAALAFMGLSVVAFVRAARAPRIELRWWLAGVGAIGLAVLSHVATGMLAVPVGLFTAALAILPRREMGWQRLGVALLPVILALAAVGGYTFWVLLPASAEYVTNPASLAYRGPDRLFSALMAYGPTGVVIAVGAATIFLGSAGDLLRRRYDGYVVLLGWFGVVWGALAYSMLSGAATDYPRFSTVLMAPVVVAAAGAVLWLAGALTRSLREIAPGAPRQAVLLAMILLLTGIFTPFAVQRFGRQAAVYQPRDAQALTAAALAIDEMLGNEHGTVLADVRDGKWVEGLTGREALFSLPVRYAFRPVEWQRSVDADTLMRSTTMMTSGLVSALYLGRHVVDGTSVPSDLLLRVNHGGEFVDMLRINPASTTVSAGHGTWTAVSALAPVRVTDSETASQAAVATVWHQSQPRIQVTQRATVWRDGAALGVRMNASGRRMRVALSPPAGARWTITDAMADQATVCLATIGGAPPCARVWVGFPDASLSVVPGGELLITTQRNGRLELLVTALTAGKASVGLGLLEPTQVVAERDVRAALLWRMAPSYQNRARRLREIGFRSAGAFGPYEVMMLPRSPVVGDNP